MKGTPKPEIPIQLDATCGKLQPKPVTTRHYVVGADKGLANVFVYIKQGAQKDPRRLVKARCSTRSAACMSRMSWASSPARNSNSQLRPILHNVHATPKGAATRNSTSPSPLKARSTEKSFDKPEVLVRMKCDVHPWMFAYVGVVDHPYFAVTDKDGNFKIERAGGKIHGGSRSSKGPARRKTEVEAGKTVNFELEVPAS